MSKTFLAAASVVTFMAAIPAFASAQEAVHIPNEVIPMKMSNGTSCPQLTIEHAVVKEASKRVEHESWFLADINSQLWEVSLRNMAMLGEGGKPSEKENISKILSSVKGVCKYAIRGPGIGVQVNMHISKLAEKNYR